MVIAIGGMPDHLHLLVRFSPTISVGDFIKNVKGSTSRLVTHSINAKEFFKWQGAYASFSVSERDLPRIKSYIERQKEHHRDDQVDELLEL